LYVRRGTFTHTLVFICLTDEKAPFKKYLRLLFHNSDFIYFISLDSDDETQEERLTSKKKSSTDDDFSAKFGRQLKSKAAAGAGEAPETFFFVEEDPRLEESLRFFFGEEERLDQNR
jgi:hypothetical protein